jgi:hypothetical protein
LVSFKRRRQRRGPWLKPISRTAARRPNDVWTVDFKGWFRIRGGPRIDPLTIRDLKSRFILDIRLLSHQTYEVVRPAMQRAFRRYGLPRAIRVDNGPPFGGPSPRGLSRLAVWWRRLGIKVDYGRPHEALRLRPPAQLYQPSPRLFPHKLPPWAYPTKWLTRRVNRQGRLYWIGRLRFIGEAFSGERIGLCAAPKGAWKVFLGQDLLGLIHLKDQSTSIRPVRWRCHI